MAAITIIQNETGYLEPEADYIDTNWVIGAGFATHYPCNAGKMTNATVQGLIAGHWYVVQYEVFDRISGGVRIGLGTNNGTLFTSNGVKKETVGCMGNNTLSFYSDGFLSIRELVIYDVAQTTSPITFSFNERNKQWANQQSFIPDMMLRFGDSFFSFKDGRPWQHNINPIRNNFYGVQYPSKITFYLNSNPGTVKLLQTIITESISPWWCPSVFIKPYTGKPFGMQSRIKVKKFKPLQGVFYANFLRNLLDPRFNTEIDALLNGEELRGRVAAITIQNDSTEEEILYKVQVKYTTQMLTP